MLLVLPMVCEFVRRETAAPGGALLCWPNRSPLVIFPPESETCSGIQPGGANIDKRSQPWGTRYRIRTAACLLAVGEGKEASRLTIQSFTNMYGTLSPLKKT